jgi:aminopeptidase N
MDVRSLTQTEAEQRAALVDVDRYDIAVDLTALPTGPEVRCVSTVTFTCRRPGAETFVDCSAEVRSATLNGVRLPPQEQGRIRLPGLAADNTLVVESVQADTTADDGVHRAVDPADGEVYAWTTFEPDAARLAWACFDQPDLKAEHVLTVDAPAAWRVVSNSGNPQVTDHGGTRRWAFPATPPLSTYNPVVLAGPLHEIRRQAGGYDLGIFARRSLREQLERDAEEIFTVTAQGLAFFGERFAMAFPQPKYDQVFMPEMGGAMENYGAVTWSDAFLSRSEPTPAEQERLALVLLHEMAHMWFGNIVTMRWWDDLWLNEAFAEFAAHWAAVEATRHTDAWASNLVGRELRAYLADQGPGSHPIRLPIRDVAEAASIFDDITYPKGAATLWQLKAYVGEEAFCAGMAAYFARHAWQNTTLDDLVAALSQASGRDLATWRAAWLETAGTDRLTLEQHDGGLALRADGPGGGPPRPHRVAVGAYHREGDTLERSGLAEVEVEGAPAPVALPAGAALYLVNDENLTFATTRPSDESRSTLLAEAGRLPTAVARAVCVATVWDMLRAGDAVAREVVPALCGVLRAETADPVLEPVLELACTTVERWAPAEERPDLGSRVAEVCRALAGSPHRRAVALRGLARTATDPDELQRLVHQAGADVDLRWWVLQRQAAIGSLDRAEADSRCAALRAEDPDPDSAARAMAVTASLADADAKHAAWQATFVDRTVPIGSAREVTRAFWRPDQEHVLAPFADVYLDLLGQLGQAGMIPALHLSVSGFPVFGIDESFLPRALEVAEQASPLVRSRVVERVDEVHRMLRSRAGGGSAAQPVGGPVAPR